MQRSLWRVILFAIFCGALATVAWFGARWVEKMPARLAAASENLLLEKAQRLREKFFQMAHFQPRLRISQRVLAETTSEIAEIALLEKEITVENEFVHTWAGSTKTVRLRGKYIVKAGYDVLDRFEIQVERGHSRILLPAPSILSVEQKELKVEAMENGLWNPISAEDLQDSTAALQDLARVRSQPLLRDVDQVFAERLRQFLGENVEIQRLSPYKSAL